MFGFNAGSKVYTWVTSTFPFLGVGGGSLSSHSSNSFLMICMIPVSARTALVSIQERLGNSRHVPKYSLESVNHVTL